MVDSRAAAPMPEAQDVQGRGLQSLGEGPQLRQQHQPAASQRQPPAQQQPLAQQPPLWHGLLAGAASGLAARLVTFPADTLKARMQLRGALGGAAAAEYRSVGAAARHLLRAEGPAGFYRGLGAVLWGVVPANLAYFGGYEAGRRLLKPSPAAAAAARPGGSLGADLATGALAQLLAGVVYTPIDIVKERSQVAGMMRPGGRRASALEGFAALRAQGGVLRGVFRGYWATNAVWLPWNCLYVAGYEQARRSAAAALGAGDARELPAWAVASCSAAAAAAAAVATHPFDVVKTRLQVLSGAPGGARLTALGLAAQQLAREGAGSFWHGLSARLLNIAPGCALSWALYEQLKVWLDGGGGR